MPGTGEKPSVFSELRGMEVFRHLEDHQIRLLDHWGVLEIYAPGGLAFESDNGQDFSVVVEGQMDVVYPTPLGDQIVTHLKAGDLVGEMAFVDGMERAGNVVARAPAKLLRLPAATVREFSKSHPAFTQALLRTFWLSLTVKLRQTMDFMAQIMEARPVGHGPSGAEKPEDIELDPSAKTALFEEQKISRGDLKLLAKIFRAERYSKEALIFSEGDSGDGLFIVAEGRVRISRRLEGMGEEALAILGRGEIFGEMALVDNEPRSADARAHASGCTVLHVDHAALEEVFRRESETCCNFLELFCRIICRRLRTMNEQLVAWRVMAGFS